MGRGTSELPTEQKVAESSHSARRKRVDPCGALRLRNDMKRERYYKDCQFFYKEKLLVAGMNKLWYVFWEKCVPYVVCNTSQSETPFFVSPYGIALVAVGEYSSKRRQARS